MTSKQNPIHLDAYQCLLHAAQMGISLDEYMEKVDDYAQKRLRMLKK